MRRQSYRLVLVSGNRAGEMLALPEDQEVLVGRGKKCGLVLDDPRVSGEHACLRCSNEGVEINDLASTHGTFVNGKRILANRRLAHNDVVRVGNTEIRFEGARETDGLHSQGQTATEQSVTGQASGRGAHSGVDMDAADGEETRYAPLRGVKSRGDGHPEDETLGPDRAESRMLSQKDLGVSQESEHLLSGDETRYQDAQDSELRGEGEPSDEETRGPADGETGLLLDRALRVRYPRPKGRTPTRFAPRTLLAVGFLAIAILLAVGAVYFFRQKAVPSGEAGGLKNYEDEQYHLSIGYPSGWVRAQGKNDLLVSFQMLDDAKNVMARCDLYARQADEYALTGLRSGFDAYQDTLSSRHTAFKLVGTKMMTVNNASVVFYVFNSDRHAGKGIYMLSGRAQVVVECSCITPLWSRLKDPFTAICSSFRLGEEQVMIDYPRPDDAMRHMALADAEKLKDESRSRMTIGENLLEHGDVRPDNLYKAMRALETSLQMAEALGVKPDFRDGAAAKLLYAKRLFDKKVLDQRFAITRALREGDKEKAYWQACGLMQMIPDKTNPDYQYAYRLTQVHDQPR